METARELTAYKLKRWKRKLQTAQTYVKKYEVKLKRLEKKELQLNVELGQQITAATRKLRFKPSD